MSTMVSNVVQDQFKPAKIFPIESLTLEEVRIFKRKLSSLVGTTQFSRRHFKSDLTLIGSRKLAFTILQHDWEMSQLVRSFGSNEIEFSEEDLYQIYILDLDGLPGEVLAREGTCNFFVMFDCMKRFYTVCLRYHNQGLGKWCADSIDEDDQFILPRGSRLFYRLPEHF